MTPAERERAARYAMVARLRKLEGAVVMRPGMLYDYSDSHPALARAEAEEQAERRARRVERWADVVIAALCLIGLVCAIVAL